ncbi:MAG: hypothetical protein H0V96_13415 [Acidimicrobiia bacterium]|nr:hypothetical protein [Acidimicrobiia bacterium]
MTDASKLFGTYLTDHRAGATVGAGLAARCHRNNAGNDFDTPLRRIADDVAEDVATLDDVMAALDVSQPRLKRLLAKVSLWASRIKLGGRPLGYSPLNRVLEIEALISGVSGKSRLWVSLGLVASQDGRLAPFDFDRLGERAIDQLERLRPLHERAAAVAFTEPEQ